MKVLFISLGCDKNLVDSEFMLGQLFDNGYEMTDDENDAEAIIINTCCFINDAKMESIETIIEMAEYKKTGKCKVLIVCGCLAQRYADEIKEEIPEVDAVIGTTAYDELASIINEVLQNKTHVKLKDINYLPKQSGRRIHSTGTVYSYLKIAEGCNKNCTYCIIPSLRGSYRSVPMDDIVRQAAELADSGVKELIIVAQETTLYGIDLYGYNALPELLNRLCEIDNIKWLRILYAYPEDITEELMDTINKQDKICAYIDMPVQHASDNILRRMGRHTTQKELIEKIEMIRSKVPGVAIRTTLITGFPGETEEDHKVLLDFIKKVRFDRLGVFKYSPEENTAAFNFEKQIDDDTNSEKSNFCRNLWLDYHKSHLLQGLVKKIAAFHLYGADRKIYTDEEIKIYSNLARRRLAEMTLLERYDCHKENFDSVRGSFFPANIPMLCILSSHRIKKIKDWYGLHKNLSENPGSKIVTLKGGKDLHLKQSERLAEEIKAFLL